MVDYIGDLSRYRFEKAENDLSSAKLLLENDHYTQSINRSYYAIFHSARSLLAYDKFDSKKHSGIISFFNQNYIKTGRISGGFFKILSGAEEMRHDSDYDDFFKPTRDQAIEQYLNAEKFIHGIDEYIKNNILNKSNPDQ
jgi:uncharacterized protein (UPF0332 family)